jgi:acyl-coenzyme A synthetase/AMP-(fatty) acid ligase
VLQQENRPNLADIYAWTRAELGAHRLPARWYVLEEIPRTSRGKLNRADVAAACARRAPVTQAALSGDRDDSTS